jgi:hypothetical protein
MLKKWHLQKMRHAINWYFPLNDGFKTNGASKPFFLTLDFFKKNRMVRNGNFPFGLGF